VPEFGTAIIGIIVASRNFDAIFELHKSGGNHSLVLVEFKQVIDIYFSI